MVNRLVWSNCDIVGSGNFFCGISLTTELAVCFDSFSNSNTEALIEQWKRSCVLLMTKYKLSH